MRNLTSTGRLRFIAFGDEVCPSTGALHYQAYLVSYKPIRMSQLIKWFGTGHNFALMRGSLKQNEDYCSKEGSFTKLGDEPRQGERHDLIGFKRKIDAGQHPLEIAEEEGHFGAFVKYHTGFEKYHHHQRMQQIKGDYSPPTIYVRIGDPGTGKTKWAYEHDPDLYTLPDLTGRWFGTYSGQPTVLFDDVEAGQVPSLAVFKSITDRYPREVPIKGGFAPWKPRTIIITSNHDIRSWWKDLTLIDYKAVMRRIYRVTRVYKDREEVEYQAPDAQA